MHVKSSTEQPRIPRSIRLREPAVRTQPMRRLLLAPALLEPQLPNPFRRISLVIS